MSLYPNCTKQFKQDTTRAFHTLLVYLAWPIDAPQLYPIASPWKYEKWWGKGTILPHYHIQGKETGHAPLTPPPYPQHTQAHFSVPEYQPVNRSRITPELPLSCRKSQSTSLYTESNTFLGLTYTESIPCHNSCWRSTRTQSASCWFPRNEPRLFRPLPHQVALNWHQQQIGKHFAFIYNNIHCLG